MKLSYKMTDSPALLEQAGDNFYAAKDAHNLKVDGLVTLLLAAEWPFLVIMALLLAPRTWEGQVSHINPHLLAAILAGPAFILPAIFTVRRFPCSAARHGLAVAQLLVSALLIDVTGGRSESHFHIFGSLAILAFYRDWRILLTASAMTALDHVARGYWYPLQVYGVLTASPWRWSEHTAWVVFEDLFLILNSRNSMRETSMVAMREAQLSWGAYYDVLTGLPNRRALQEHFDSCVAADPSAPRAVLFVDLDHFKQANDTLGHAVGDKLLKNITSRLEGLFGPSEMLARIGGDEFIASVPVRPAPSSPEDHATTLLTALATPFDIDGHRLLLSASIGMALYPDHGRDLSELQERADRAMYLAKARGRNQAVVFSTEVARRELTLQEVARDLPEAVNRRQMRLWFQPLVHSDGALTGFEALLRWTHPTHGAIPPLDFIPIAERSGHIIALGEWVIEEAARQCVEWNHRGCSLGVAVNVSATQIEQGDFAAKVIKIVARTGLDPRLLTLELTESILVHDGPNALHHLAELRAHGVRVALDDFGTGYSSLSYLATLPADTLKLDRSFLRKNGVAASAVVESVIEMAHRIGMRVVAEGVETDDQRNHLRALDCDEMQGFFFSPPIPSHRVEAYLDSTAPRVPEPSDPSLVAV